MENGKSANGVDHGGKVPRGRGRPKGSRNKQTLKNIEKAEKLGITPLEVMLHCMAVQWRKRRYEAAGMWAEKCAPYVHPTERVHL
jgi:hypothetical protein